MKLRTNSMLKTIITATFLLAISADAYAKSVDIKEADYGEKWPFTVSEGVLSCSKNEVVFRFEGIAYAVNGSAKTAGYQPIEPIWKLNMPIIKELAEAYGKTVEEMSTESPMRLSIGPIIKDGLALCRG